MMNILRQLLLNLGVSITSKSNMERLILLERSGLRWQCLRDISQEQQEHIFKSIDLLTRSHSQLYQEFYAYKANAFVEKGFFVEFGAKDGVSHSNTWWLEQVLGWNGILSEPAISVRDHLTKNRKCALDFRCVWKETGLKVEFAEADVQGLSTISGYAHSDSHFKERKSSRLYQVDTVSLEDLLRENGAPQFINYLSIDTEGSEYEILRHFDFKRYRFGFISCEHNYTENRAKIYEILIKNGYKRVLEDISRFDDWYVPVDCTRFDSK